ncbi:MAG: hypothetical protein WAW86_09990 [Gammaproteobacteria bacterium]
MAEEWIARANAPPSDSMTDWFVVDAQFATIDKQAEQKEIDLINRQSLETVKYNQYSAFLQMLDYQKRQERIDAEIYAFTASIKKMDDDLELRKIHMPQHFGFFSPTSSLAHMEPNISLNLDAPDDFPLSFSEI